MLADVAARDRAVDLGDGATRVRVLDRVRQQVGQHLDEPHGVAEDERGGAIAMHPELMLARVGARTRVVDCFGDDVLQHERLAAQLQLAGLEARHVEQVVDQPTDMVDLALDDPAHALGHRLVGVVLHQLHRGL
jgi:sugar/nucleoside kinase (ribokinase family)